MITKTGIYTVTDGEFHADWQGVQLKLKHYIRVVVLSHNGVDIMFLSQIKEERHITTDGINVDNVDVKEFAETINATPYYGSNIDAIKGGILSMGFVNPIFEWETELV